MGPDSNCAGEGLYYLKYCNSNLCNNLNGTVSLSPTTGGQCQNSPFVQWVSNVKKAAKVIGGVIIAAIVAPIVVGILICVLICFCCCKKKQGPPQVIVMQQTPPQLVQMTPAPLQSTVVMK